MKERNNMYELIEELREKANKGEIDSCLLADADGRVVIVGTTTSVKVMLTSMMDSLLNKQVLSKKDIEYCLELASMNSSKLKKEAIKKLKDLLEKMEKGE
jgi:hypothetical protein